MVIIIARALQDGWKTGITISLGALAIDIIRVLSAVFILGILPRTNAVFRIIDVAGALFLLYMAYTAFTYKPSLVLPSAERRGVLLGMVGNLLNPSAYLFWLTVGGPIMLAARNSGSSLGEVGFASGFLLAVTAVNIFVALLAGKIRSYMDSVYYKYVLGALGLVLVVFACLFLKQAYHFLIA